MNKKVLVLTLALVVAFASSAMAAVTFSGKFTATAEQKSFKVFQDAYTLTSGITFAASAKNNDDAIDWDFTGAINLDAAGALKFGKFKLGLYDNYFKAYVWGNGQELTDKATYFGMISAGKAAAATGTRARLEVPVMDVAKVTLDLTAPDNIRAFADVTVVEGVDLAIAYARKDWTTAAKDVIVAQAGTTVSNIDLKAAAGVTLGTNLGFAVGASAESKITEQIKVNGSVTHANADWAGDGATVKANNTVIAAGGSYTEDEYQVSLTEKYTIVKGGTNVNLITLGAKYRMSNAVAYADLFDAKKWFNNTAPAFGVSATLEDFKFETVTDKVRADVTAPVLENMIWAKAYAEYKGDKAFGAGVLGHILATNKLTVKPSVDFVSLNKDIDVKLAADYKIGAGTATLSFLAQKVFSDAVANQKSLLKLSVEVPF